LILVDDNKIDTSLKVSPFKPRLSELAKAPFENVFASNLITPEGNSLLRKSVAVFANSPYLTTPYFRNYTDLVCTVCLVVGHVDWNAGAHSGKGI
jgi:hypothetical protein